MLFIWPFPLFFNTTLKCTIDVCFQLKDDLFASVRMFQIYLKYQQAKT